MKTLLLSFLLSKPLAYLCAPKDIEGASLRLEPIQARLCLGAGSPESPDFCQGPWAKIYPIESIHQGQMKKNEMWISFTEYLARKESDLFVIRLYEKSFPDIYPVHHADILSSVYHVGYSVDQDRAPREGGPVCYELPK